MPLISPKTLSTSYFHDKALVIAGYPNKHEQTFVSSYKINSDLNENDPSHDFFRSHLTSGFTLRYTNRQN